MLLRFSPISTNKSNTISRSHGKMDQIPGELADDVENAITMALEDRGAGLWDAKGVIPPHAYWDGSQEFPEPLMERITEVLILTLPSFFDDACFCSRTWAPWTTNLFRVFSERGQRYTAPGTSRCRFRPHRTVPRQHVSSCRTGLTRRTRNYGSKARAEVERAQEILFKTALSLKRKVHFATVGGADEMV